MNSDPAALRVVASILYLAALISYVAIPVFGMLIVGSAACGWFAKRRLDRTTCLIAAGLIAVPAAMLLMGSVGVAMNAGPNAWFQLSVAPAAAAGLIGVRSWQRRRASRALSRCSGNQAKAQ